MLQAAHPPVERLGPARPAQAGDIVLQEPVGTVLLARDPLDIDFQVLLNDEVLEHGPLPDEAWVADPLLAGEVPDHHLAVGPDPGMAVVRQVLEGQNDGVELGLVVRCPTLVGEKHLFAGKEGDGMAVAAPVNHDLDSVMHRLATGTRGWQKRAGDRARRTILEKKGVGSAGEGRQVIRPPLLTPVSLQPALYLRVSLQGYHRHAI